MERWDALKGAAGDAWQRDAAAAPAEGAGAAAAPEEDAVLRTGGAAHCLAVLKGDAAHVRAKREAWKRGGRALRGRLFGPSPDAPGAAPREDAADPGRAAVLRRVFHRDSAGKQLLWGLLHVKILKCQKLRNRDFLQLANVVSLATRGEVDKSDPYVMAFLDDYRLLKTRYVPVDLNPVFNEEFYCPVAHVAEGITFKVKDRDHLWDDDLGSYTLPASELIQLVDETDVEAGADVAPGDLKRVGVHKTVYLDGKRHHGSLEFFVEFVPTNMLALTMEVPGVYFEATPGNAVKLYMNADDDGSSPVVRYGGPRAADRVWTPPRLWRDIYDAVCAARHLVYVAGWSIDTDQCLLRGEELRAARARGRYSPRVGELFKKKADEGAAVNVLQWSDYSSNAVFSGVMGTCDEKTRQYFRGTRVRARLVGMIGGKCNTVLEGQRKQMEFTHHQKFIVCDAPRPDGEGRELVAFVGGIDLTAGRWDNQQHPLFRSLQSQHKDDTYTQCFNLSAKHGPREPWHDIHSAVRGPAALHLAQAFEERWTKQGDAKELVDRRSLGLDSGETLENDGGWCAQLSRSIDSRVDCFDPVLSKRSGSLLRYVVDADLWRATKEKHAPCARRFETAAGAGVRYSHRLDHKKGRLVDNSIHLHHIHHIRRAEHFIYIESQYFMGSSFMWATDRHVKCGNMIAAEISLKICAKIAAREPFSVYILLPMWMEGLPQSNALQGLLYYQRLTIEAMYRRVQLALDARMANSPDHGLKASDYLNFYCLGNRETSAGSQATGVPVTDDEVLLAKTRRHQIYVHSKMMIVDDNVVLIGTANINQRSMDGCRDSEIMMTSWQPEHLATKEALPQGDVHAFRLHTWASNTGQMNEAFRRPHSPECVAAVNEIAERNWQTYLAAETTDMHSHLLPFPLEFEGGEIRPRTGLLGDTFPDTKASVLGKHCITMPEIVLT